MSPSSHLENAVVGVPTASTF